MPFSSTNCRAVTDLRGTPEFLVQPNFESQVRILPGGPAAIVVTGEEHLATVQQRRQRQRLSDASGGQVPEHDDLVVSAHGLGVAVILIARQDALP
jgi:hypothetical protein